MATSFDPLVARPGTGARAENEALAERLGMHALSLVVIAAAEITPSCRRITVGGDDLADLEPAAGQDLMFSFGVDEGRTRRRRYTIRHFDRVKRTVDLDIALHGDGPGVSWATTAERGAVVEAIGPRGKVTIDPSARWHLFIGDDSFAPAALTMAEALSDDHEVLLALEIDGKGHEQPDDIVAPVAGPRWVLRGNGEVGDPGPLLAALETISLPHGPGHASVGGEHAVVGALRDALQSRGMDAESISFKPYWRLGARTPPTASPSPRRRQAETMSGTSLEHWSGHLPDGLDPEDLDLTAQVSLPAAWSKRWRADPSARVLRGPEGAWLSAAELLERTAAVAGRLVASGARPGDRVLIAGAASSDLVVAHVACLRAGLVVVPVNPAAARRELEVVIAAARPSAAIVGSDALGAWVGEIDSAIVATSPDVGLDDGLVPPLDAVGGADVAMLMYTSGTTGAPKGVELSHANLLAGADAVRLAWGWTSEDTLVLCLPLSHVHGLAIGLHGGLLTGSPVFLMDRFEPETILDAAAHATMLFGVPTMYQRLVAAEGCERLGRLRLCVCGSAPLGPELHRRIEERCGQIVLERYGMTETLLTVSNPLRGERRAGTVGFPLPGVELRLDPETHEICVRGPSVFAGYRELPEVTAASFDDGWFRTGDIGAIEDGYLRMVGRAKELIITGGYNVYPREVEDVLRAFPGVRDAAVIGTPSKEWGETVTAFIEATADLDLGALSEHASSELAFYKRPRFLQRVDELPRNLLGKVMKERLSAPEPSA